MYTHQKKWGFFGWLVGFFVVGFFFGFFFWFFFPLCSLNTDKCTFGTVSSMLCSSSCELCFNDCGLTPWCRKFFFV